MRISFPLIRKQEGGIPMKKLGFGLMRLPTTEPDNPSKIDMEQVKKMVDLFLEKGFC